MISAYSACLHSRRWFLVQGEDIRLFIQHSINNLFAFSRKFLRGLLSEVVYPKLNYGDNKSVWYVLRFFQLCYPEYTGSTRIHLWNTTLIESESNSILESEWHAGWWFLARQICSSSSTAAPQRGLLTSLLDATGRLLCPPSSQLRCFLCL